MQAKDPTTNEVILEGRAKGGLYELSLNLNQVGDALSVLISPIHCGTVILVILTLHT